MSSYSTRSVVPRPVVIGHRGAAGYRPEHTEASYRLAAAQGADFLEPDLVSTADGVLVVRHENEIGGTTDVAEHPEFADRRRSKTVDGAPVTGWFTEDFTLAELRTLATRERLPQLRPGNVEHEIGEPVLTFAELLALRAELSREHGRTIGVYPETKHPTYFAGLGLALEEPLLADLRAAGLDSDDPAASVFVQSFELGSLRRLRHELGSRAPQVLLTSVDGVPADLLSPEGLATLAGTVDGIGADKLQVIGWDPEQRLGSPTGLVDDAHAAGLLVHAWTFRAENAFLPAELRSSTDPAAHGDMAAEIAAYLQAGVDGVFVDHPDLGVAARDAATPVDR